MTGQRVVVIGAGITGCSTAYQLAAGGCQQVTVLDKAHVAGGPTGFSSDTSSCLKQYAGHSHPWWDC